MTHEIKEILYNKTAQELTIEDKIYLNKVLNAKQVLKNRALYGCGVTLLLTTIFTVPFLFVKGVVPAIFAALFGGVSFITGCSATFSGQKDVYKELGLTRKEFKELIKSGRLGELRELTNTINFELIKKIEDNQQSLGNLQKDELAIKIGIKEEKKQAKSLIQKMIEEKQITQEEADAYINKIDNKQETEILDFNEIGD